MTRGAVSLTLLCSSVTFNSVSPDGMEFGAAAAISSATAQQGADCHTQLFTDYACPDGVTCIDYYCDWVPWENNCVYQGVQECLCCDFEIQECWYVFKTVASWWWCET